MPGRDRSGPAGGGPMTGNGFGACNGANAVSPGAGFGKESGVGLNCRRGFDRGFGRRLTNCQISSKTEKELLQTQKNILQNRLKVIDKRLENL